MAFKTGVTLSREKTSQPPRDSLLLKASILPTEVTHWLARLDNTTRQRTLGSRWRAHAGHGIISARLVGDPEALVGAVAPLRQAALECRGSLVVADAPAAIAGTVDVWGPSSALAVMRSLKERFDPNGTLNPGRFVGGI